MGGLYGEKVAARWAANTGHLPTQTPALAMKRGTIITLLVIIAFGVLLLFNTLSAQKVECDVCVDFKGQHNCAKASHENEDDAKRAAQNTACGPITAGMDQTIACGRVTPASAVCRKR
jgi:hypothetical protein